MQLTTAAVSMEATLQTVTDYYMRQHINKVLLFLIHFVELCDQLHIFSQFCAP